MTIVQRRLGVVASLLTCALLAGCSSVGSLTGAVTGAAAGGGSVNPGVGYAVGIGTKAATDALVQYISRKRQQAEQDHIAAVVGALQVGQSAPWAIKQKIPLLDDEHGSLTIVRDIDNALAACKEVVFTVDGKTPDSSRGHYVTTACLDGGTWKWALAEPSTARWGYLQ
ncbi:MAG: hypothetical protein ACYDD1_13950 [Caulobacteraceae bacterium]